MATIDQLNSASEVDPSDDFPVYKHGAGAVRRVSAQKIVDMAIDQLALTPAANQSAAIARLEGESNAAAAALDAMQLPDYAALRAYRGPRKSVYVTGVLGTAAPSGIAGMIVFDPNDTTSPDNGGTCFVTVDGKRFKRVFDGMPFIEWFGADRSGVKVSSAAIQAAYDAHGYVQAGDGVFLIDAPLVITKKGGFFCNKRGTTFKKTTATANNITRSIVDVAGVPKSLTWNLPVVFDLVCPDNSYLIDFQVDGLSFDLPSNGSVGVFNAQRVAHSSFRNLYCNNSAFFAKGYDLWMVEWANIRSRDSKNHFSIDTGTSNSFRNVHCDRKNTAGGSGFSLSKLNYTEMSACGADSLDRAYYFDGATVTMNGCGAETFSRVVHAVNGADVTINGGSLAVYKVAEAAGMQFPYQFDGDGTRVRINGTWLGIANPADAGGTYGAMYVTNGAEVTLRDARRPVEIGSAGWWYVANAKSVLTILDKEGTSYINQYGISTMDATSNIKAFKATKSIPAGSSQSVFRINNASYGASCFGRIKVFLHNLYTPEIGFAGSQTYEFTCFNEATQAQVLTKTGDALVRSHNASSTALGTVTATFLRNADNTVDFQYAIPAGFGNTNVTVIVEYMNYVGGNQAADPISAV